MGLQPGDRFGRYELVSRLGHGGMAETWRAKLLAAAGITKPVLIKRILPEYASDYAFTSMFISEARITATLSHGNIAQVHDFGEVDGEYFLAMEFVDGRPLDRIIKRAQRSGHGAFPTPLAIFIALEMSRGLHYAHTRVDESGKPLGIVHRDISPDNVLISYEGQVKIVDFGIAKARMQRNFQTEPGMVKGKYLFFSPEQARGEEVDGRTDVWATGVVLYELLCGRLPVTGPEYVAIPKLMCGAFPRPSVLRPDLPAKLEALVMKALALKREERFESSHAFGDALTGYLYSSTPRFSALSLSHFVQELFREDLSAEGRVVQVPASFHEELAQWRLPPTAPTQPAEPVTQPLPPAVDTETLPVEPPSESTRIPVVPRRGRKVRVRVRRRHSGLVWTLLAVVAVAGLVLAGVELRPDRLVSEWLDATFPLPKVTPTAGAATVASSNPAPPQPRPATETAPGTATPPQEPVKPGTEGYEAAAPSTSEKPRPPQEAPPAPARQLTKAEAKAAWAMAEKARVLMRKARFKEAAEELSRCLELDPHHGDCRRLNSDVLMQLGQPDRARHHMQEYLRNPPTERPPDLPKKPLPSYSGAHEPL
ncbi:serine/threonine-protein kinase [Hyalangium gracile]|uniref:serine/threonine-protein kinase n=1 Tax=Hyalangium gracile TaxID=394092 RepID=UPI001CCFAAE0|nr:serine/threonine-protein kinase [Hyalangium gracile]